MLRTRISGAALLAVAALVAPSAPAWADAHSPGSSGVGDPYFPHAGNGGYDVQHYDLKLRYTPKSGRIDSTATITAKAVKGLSRFNLDLSGLTVRSVTVDGKKAKWSRKGQELTVTPKKGIDDEATFKVVVEYDGTPKPVDDSDLGVTGFIRTKDGAVVVSQPDGARTWFPANDTPRDKATFSYEISAPAGLTVLANGEPQNSGIVRVKKGYVVSRWRMKQPMAPYLAMIAIGKYKVSEGTAGGVLNITAYDPALAKTSKHLHAETAEATKWGIEHFGPYPFDSTGGIADKLGVHYALETQGRPVYDGDASDDLLIVHEIAHQWFGNSVGLESWNDIWLNEGLASYAEWLYEETHNGPKAQTTFDKYYKSTGDFWDVKTGAPGKKNMFDWEAIYLRGAMTVHALRTEIGDETFFGLLKEWADRNRHETATTKDFIALAEELSGKDLGPLFKKWLYTAKKPAL